MRASAKLREAREFVGLARFNAHIPQISASTSSPKDKHTEEEEILEMLRTMTSEKVFVRNDRRSSSLKLELAGRQLDIFLGVLAAVCVLCARICVCVRFC